MGPTVTIPVQDPLAVLLWFIYLFIYCWTFLLSIILRDNFKLYKVFFRAALHYLGCTELSSLSVEEQREKAYLLSIAALLGKDVYNFGELLAHPGNFLLIV